MLSILFLSLGSAGRKHLTDKYLLMLVSAAKLNEMKNNCKETFKKPRKRTLERYKFFARQQQPNETLRHFWNALTGLAARCEIEQQTESLIMDTFIQNTHNKTVQERLCTEPKDQPKEALNFAVAFEEGISQQKSFGGGSEIKKGPLYAIDNRGKLPCTRCGLEFSQNHLAVCKAKNEKCRNCGVIGQFMRACKRPFTVNVRGNVRSSNRGTSRRIDLIGQAADQSKESSE